MNPAAPDPPFFGDQSTITHKKPHEVPELIELGNVADLTNYSVSVQVSGIKEGSPIRARGQP